MKGMKTMGLNFRNSTSETIFVAYAYPDFSCSPVNYATIGWYRIEPGQSRQVWSGYAGGNTFFYYAESDSYTWSGGYYTEIPNDAFNQCWDSDCNDCRELGFRRIPVRSSVRNYTVVLISSSSRSKKGLIHLRTALPTKPGKRLTRRVPLKARKLAPGRPVLAKRRAVPKRRRR
ncbi:DUF1036 domain-containing protein [Paenibacillus sp. FSL L8-0470]|uniref:DUF1036 domain-containing protein n=2 Tax=Paenibacillus TaxID=44249 RepID=UPI0030F6C9DD